MTKCFLGCRHYKKVINYVMRDKILYNALSDFDMKILNLRNDLRYMDILN